MGVNTTSIIISVITTILGAGGTLGYYFERRKRMADAESKEINNGQQVVNLYKQALDDLATRYETKFKEITKFYEDKVALERAKFKEITALYENKEKVLKAEIRTHKRYVNALKKEASDLRKQIKELKAA